MITLNSNYNPLMDSNRTSIGAINRVFAPIWTGLGMDVASKQFLERFLREPTIEVLRAIYLSDEPDEYRQYMRAHTFNIVADTYLHRTARSARVADPRRAEWNYNKWGIQPISSKYVKYVEAEAVEKVVGVHDERKEVTYTAKEPLGNFEHRFREVTRSKVVDVTVEDTITLICLRFNDGYTEEVNKYVLSAKEEKRYHQLEAVCKALNTLYAGAPAGRRAGYKALINIDPVTGQFAPVGVAGADTFSF